MVETTLTVKHKVGLHARPAATFVKTAKTFQAEITMTNLTRNGAPINAKSILSVLKAAVAKDHIIHLQAEGEDAQAAITALTQLIETNFGEQ